MNFDLLGYNANFKNGDVTIKLHQKKYAKLPDIHLLSDVFNKSIDQLIDLKIDDKVQHLPPDIVLDPVNVQDEHIINSVAQEIEKDIKNDLLQLSDDEKDLILVDLDKLLIHSNTSKDITKRGAAGLIVAKLKSLVSNNPIFKDLHLNTKNKISSDLYQRYKEKYL